MAQLVSKLATFCLAVVAAAGLVTAPGTGHGQQENPAIRLPNPDGKDRIFDQSNAREPVSIEFSDLAAITELSLANSSGKLRLINFWATWCAPCVKELPSLAALAARHSASPFQVIPISLDRAGPEAVSAFLANLDVRGLEWFIDPSRLSGKAADVFALPTSVIVDQDGRERGRVVGSVDWASEEASSLIEALLQELE